MGSTLRMYSELKPPATLIQTIISSLDSSEYGYNNSAFLIGLLWWPYKLPQVKNLEWVLAHNKSVVAQCHL